MKKTFILLFGVTCLIFENCKESDHTFREIDQVATSTVLIGSDDLGDPWDIEVFGNYLIIGNETIEPLINVYNLDKKIFTVRGIKKGFYRNDIRIIGSIHNNTKFQSVDIYDLFEKKILRFDFHSLKQNILIPDTIYFPISKQRIQQNSIDKLLEGPDYYIAETRASEKQLLLIKGTDSVIMKQVPYPKSTYQDITDSEFAKWFSISMRINYSKKMFVTSTFNADIINLFKIEKDSLRSVWFHKGFLPSGLQKMSYEGDNIIAATKDSKVGYIDMTSNASSIYLIFSGKDGKDVKNPHFSNLIRVLNWEGRKRYEFKIDKPIERIAVSLDNKYLYGVAESTNGEPEIICIKIPKFK